MLPRPVLNSTKSLACLLLGLDTALGCGFLGCSFDSRFTGGLASRLLGSRRLGGLLLHLLDGLNERITLALQCLDDLLLLDEESAHNTLTQAAMAQDTTVGAGHGLVALGQTWALAGAGGGDALKLLLALAAAWYGPVLLHILVDQTTTGSADAVNKIRTIRFQRKRHICTITYMRLLLDLVLYDRRLLKVKRWTIVRLFMIPFPIAMTTQPKVQYTN